MKAGLAVLAALSGLVTLAGCSGAASAGGAFASPAPPSSAPPSSAPSAAIHAATASPSGGWTVGTCKMMIENTENHTVMPDTAANYATLASGVTGMIYPVFSLTNNSGKAAQPPNATVTFSDTPQKESTASPYVARHSRWS